MKIVIKENQFKTLINEDLGVSRASIAYVNLIFNKIKDVVIDFTKNSKKNEKQKEHIVIGVDDIKTIWQSSLDDFLDLPIEVINIEISMLNLPKKRMNREFATGGAAYLVGEKKTGSSYIKKPSLLIPQYILNEPELNKTLVSSIDFDIFINEDYNNSMENELLYDLRDTITHEMNHVLEHFMRGLRGKPIDLRLTYSGAKNYNIPKEIFATWNEFLTYLYFSEPFEINAMTQEMYSKKLRMSFEEIQQTKYWKYAKKMENFDADNFFDELVSKIQERDPDTLIVILTNLWNWFMKDYIKLSKVQKLNPSKKIYKTAEVRGLMKALEPRIKNAGKKLLRNFTRLYGINPEN
jgi:hypothetical protein